MADSERSYRDDLAHLKALIDLAIAEGGLPQELRSGSLEADDSERARLAELARIVMQEDPKAFEEAVEAASAVAGFNRATRGETERVPELEEAKERVLKRIKEEEAPSGSQPDQD